MLLGLCGDGIDRTWCDTGTAAGARLPVDFWRSGTAEFWKSDRPRLALILAKPADDALLAQAISTKRHGQVPRSSIGTTGMQGARLTRPVTITTERTFTIGERNNREAAPPGLNDIFRASRNAVITARTLIGKSRFTQCPRRSDNVPRAKNIASEE
jgi:hypothetical protein